MEPATIRDMTLLIAMPGPPLPEKGSAMAPQREALPQLPQLTRLLAAARRLPGSADWRAGVLSCLHGGTAPDWPPAAVAACGLHGLAAGQPLCFATPLYLEAGISRVHLPPHGLLALDATEQEAWREAFNQEFGVAGAWLHAVPGGWLLVSSAAAAAEDAPPSRLLGAALERRPATGDEQRQLRRLGTEVEMWLAAHPLNAAREARRRPPVNCFWFWGGAHFRQLPPLAQPPRDMHGPAQPDPWLAGLAQHAGVAPVQIAESWHAVRHLQHGLVVPAADEAGAARAQWQQLEASWFEPMAQALRAGELPPLRLQIGASAWQLPATRLRGWLQSMRRLAWWEMLQQ